MAVIQQTKSRPMRYRKKIIISLSLLLFISMLMVVTISIYVGQNLTQPERREITQFPTDFGLIYEDVSFLSKKDDLSLSGWWVPAQNDGVEVEAEHTVIFAHGYGDVRTQEKITTLQLAKRLTNEGYHVLLFDFRGSGKSDGELVTIGQFEKDDLLGATSFVKEEKGSEKISVIGWSMGAVTAILAMTESDDIRAVVADSPFADLEEYLTENLPYWSGLPSFPFTSLIINIIPHLSGIVAEEVSPYQAVENIGEDRLFLIHSTDDEPIPYSNSERIFGAIPNTEQVELWVTEGGGHIESYLTDKLEYEERVLAFLQNE
ncbi:hypothetical protein BKP35_08385 [Anaerobacillus arseniciselenatis]|uniref:Serine aminopeptidase S33 domain-containing protein n=1 Tax=Anaerobacillus arseniciselenatis TaxID=85682 RepID=A0A1S2LMN1_9BACI|nr:alpha/beta fold hydrolase [Anaerobacillus arseniciselenatis]OIJ13788.1 hypothetical protein BKP35_08385 [Anaerobacillus arseniciselenatis]